MDDKKRITGAELVDAVDLIQRTSEGIQVDVMSALLSGICNPSSEGALRELDDDVARALSRCMEAKK